MKVKLFFGNHEAIKKSGIGRALIHQKQALELAGIEYTVDNNCYDYDILHINVVLPSALKELKYARKHNKAILYHAHSTCEDFKNSFMFSNILAPSFKKWLVYLYSQGDMLITPTPYAKKILLSYNINKPIKDLSNGINISDFTPTNSQIELFNKTYGILENDQVVIGVGWLFERKGFDTFIEVATLLPNIKFIWFGDIHASNPTLKIKKLIRNLPTNVILPGYVDGTVIKGAYGRANIFFFPSREETEGIVVLEALSAKISILLRDIPVFEPWLNDGVNCYKRNDVLGFKKAIEDILIKKLSDTTESGFEIVKNRQLEYIGQELKKVYQFILRG